MLLCVLNFLFPQFFLFAALEQEKEEENEKSTHHNNKVCFIIFHASVVTITFYSNG